MSFWEVFILLVVFVPMAIIWGMAIVDVFRRHDLSGTRKALWLVVIILLPLIGTVAYLIAHAGGEGAPDMRRDVARSSSGFMVSSAPVEAGRAQELSALADLHDRGKLTDEEFAAEKDRVLRSNTP